MVNDISKKPCKLCAAKVKAVDYKDIDLLQQFISPYAKIIPKRRSGNCAKHQRMVAKAIKRARHLALLPFVST